MAFNRIDLHNAHLTRRLASFSNHRRLTDLAIMNCNIGSESLRIPLDAFVNHPTDSLRYLDSTGNYLGDIDWSKFVEALSGQGNLQSLLINYCQIGRKGCNAVAKLLRRQHSNLNYLSLSGNSIDDVGREHQTRSVGTL